MSTVEEADVKKVKVFPDNEPIWVFTTDLSLKKRIDDGLYRETVSLKTPVDLSNEISKNLVDKNNRVVNASIIFTNVMDGSVIGNTSLIQSVIDTINKKAKNKDYVYIKTYEIGINVGKEYSMFKGSMRFGTVDDFILYAQDSYREQNIRDLDPADKNTQLIKSLNIDLNISKKRIEELEKEIEDNEEVVYNARAELQSLKTKVEHEYTPEIKSLKELVSSLEQKAEDLKIKLKVEESRSKKYQEEKDNIFTEKEEIYNKNLGLEEMLKNRETSMDLLKIQIDNKEKEILDLVRRNDEIIESRVDSEVVTKLNQEIDKLKDRLNNLNMEHEILKRKKSSLEIELDLNRNKLEDIRRGTNAMENLGRTSIIDKGTFDKLSIIYFKVFDDLPFHRSMLNILINVVLPSEVDSEVGKRIRTVILKHDDGMDGEVFDGVKLVSKLRDVKDTDTIVRVLPNSTMLDGKEDFENKTSLLVVVDYVSDNNYYIDTLGKKSVYNIVKRASDLDKYKLRGKAITLDSTSSYPLRFDNKLFGNTEFYKNKAIESTIRNTILHEIKYDGITK